MDAGAAANIDPMRDQELAANEMQRRIKQY